MKERKRKKMASMTKIDYLRVRNYIAQFTWHKEPLMLLLGYNVDNKFQFVDLAAGRIMNLTFETVEDAEKWLGSVAEILERDAICQTYVP